ncbi:hypothetical protein SCWH03_07970 [Streptomyces pacificus]|uniref:Uncharacterized protein n=1 Tax=Streptomyces pacificus TaxID=2705029 RepID=A0A6A0AQJ9_9ACTN|nr:hypothetical protein SCWH03_07970 [Streptomyces pacificus]
MDSSAPAPGRPRAYPGLRTDGTSEGDREAGRLSPFVRLECDPACHRPRGRGRTAGG